VALSGLLRLVRWPGALTAAANAMTGFLVAHRATTREEAVAAAGVALGGALVYAGGVALNDVADAERDRTIHPERPIPSGRVGRAAAATFGLALLVGGAGLSMAAGGVWAGAATAAAALFAWIYDFGAKKFVVAGAAALGLARAANAVAGALASSTPDALFGPAAPPHAALYPAAVLAYAAILVVVSTREESRPGPVALGASATSLFVAAALPWAVFAAAWRFAPALAYAPLLVVLVGAARDSASPDGPGVGALVRAAVFGFLLVDAAWLFGVARYGEGFALVMVYVAVRLALSRARS